MEQQWALMNANDRFRASLRAHFITENGKEKCVRCGWARKRLNPAQKRQHLLHESGEVLSCLILFIYQHNVIAFREFERTLAVRSLGEELLTPCWHNP